MREPFCRLSRVLNCHEEARTKAGSEAELHERAQVIKQASKVPKRNLSLSLSLSPSHSTVDSLPHSRRLKGLHALRRCASSLRDGLSPKEGVDYFYNSSVAFL